MYTKYEALQSARWNNVCNHHKKISFNDRTRKIKKKFLNAIYRIPRSQATGELAFYLHSKIKNTFVFLQCNNNEEHKEERIKKKTNKQTNK